MKVEGIEKIKAKMQRLGIVFSDLAEPAIKAAAELLRQEISNRAPIRTGKLSKNIIAKTEVQQGTAIASVGSTKEVFYARFLELGTKKMAAKPFIRPAFDEKKQAMKREAQRVFSEGIKKL